MAPEQERGEGKVLVDQRTDVFALGSILNISLQERPVATREGIPAPCGQFAPKPCPPEMSARYGSVQELAADVGKYLDDMPVNAYRENIFERTARLVSRNEWPWYWFWHISLCACCLFFFRGAEFLFFVKGPGGKSG